MPEAVMEANQVSINGVRYKISGPVQRTLSSNYPGKLVTGDYTRDSHPTLSTLALSDHRGGIGLDIMEGQGDTDRSWYSTADLRFKGRLILPPLATASSTLPAGTDAFKALVEFAGQVYVWIDATTNGIYRYSGTTWGSNVLAVSGITDGVSGVIGGASYIVFCDGSNFYYSTTGAAASFTTDTTNATYLVIWDDKLFGIDAANGQLWYVPTPGATPVVNATLLLERAAELRGLMVGPDASGEDIIYALTSHGLYALDFDNGRFIKTAVSVPNKTTSSYTTAVTACVWRGKIYFTAETTILEYDPVGGTIRDIGLYRDGGLPSTYAGTVAWLRPSLNDLIAATGIDTTSPSRVLAWDGHGWRVLASVTLNSGSAVNPTALLVSGAYGAYRVWWAEDDVTGTAQAVKYLSLPSDFVNPLQITTYTYATAATHDWPWFTAGQSEVTKVAVRVKVETLDPTTAETVILSYATDWVETFTAFATITTAGVTTFPFPSATTPTGTAFKSIRFRAALARGSTTTRTPQVIAVTLEYYKKLDPKYQFQVTLDLNNAGPGGTPKEQRASLLTAIETATLVEFTYRDPVSNSDATFYVQVRPQESSEMTGLDERGSSTLLLVEV